MFSSYYITGLLRQVSAEQARDYLGIQNISVPPLPPPSTIEWPQSVSKSADQSVENTDTPRDDDELFVTVEANAFYLVELFLLYSGNSTSGDYRGRITFPSLLGGGTAIGYVVAFGANLLPDITAVQKGTVTNFPTNDVVIGIPADNEFACAQLRFQIRTVLPGTLKYQFANGNGADGRIVTTRAGSLLRMQRLI